MILLIILGYIIGYILCGILAVGAIAKIEGMTIDEVCDDDDTQKAALVGVVLMPFTVIILFAILFGKIFVLCLKYVYKLNQNDTEKNAKKETKEAERIAKEAERIAKEAEKEKERKEKAEKVTRFDLVDLSE